MKNKVSEVQYIARIAELEEENRYLKGQLDNYQKIKEEDIRKLWNTINELKKYRNQLEVLRMGVNNG